MARAGRHHPARPGLLHPPSSPLLSTSPQGEAPPGALFSKFKAVIEEEGVDASDVAFYFVHWLTDLAGAEPTPLRGAEKFTVRFPHAVLHKFIGSFHVVQRLADTAPTELLQDYLVKSWPVDLLGNATHGGAALYPIPYTLRPAPCALE